MAVMTGRRTPGRSLGTGGFFSSEICTCLEPSAELPRNHSIETFSSKNVPKRLEALKKAIQAVLPMVGYPGWSFSCAHAELTSAFPGFPIRIKTQKKPWKEPGLSQHDGVVATWLTSI